MVVDFHTHVFPDKIARSTIEALAKSSNTIPYTDGTVSGMLDAIETAKVDIAISLPVLTKPTQFDSVLNFALTVNEKFKNENRKLISFAGIHPACEDIKGKMRLVKESGLKGVKIHPDYQSTYIDDDGYIEILKSAREFDLIVVTHAGVDDGYLGQTVKCPPDLCRKVIDRVGHKKFVLGHYGGHKQWQDVLKLLCDCDVYFDTAFTMHEIDKELFLKILEKHGDDKILFATDCPWRDISKDLQIVKSYVNDQNSLNKILYKNALNLLELDKNYDL